MGGTRHFIGAPLAALDGRPARAAAIAAQPALVTKATGLDGMGPLQLRPSPTPSLPMRTQHFQKACLVLAVGLAACGPAKTPSRASAQATASTASAPGASAASATAPPAALPAEITAFRARRDACDHFRGEEAYDAQRAAFLQAQLKKHCTGTDRELADLRRRYASDANALAALKDYEDQVE
ncbi:hypothetical protein [Azohydromonas caseinilytica]|uniref:Uncharacterized protein n=1 Tax=Azohydromonas caseinilytica TaxID=2728836 RepID=A0A848F5V5_9BURK|nr:hypothetical protein [Azohydromonas caseinilytica]NML14046.1 hypothetical protein [Azohydromonas caseinilytica]